MTLKKIMKALRECRRADDWKTLREAGRHFIIRGKPSQGDPWRVVADVPMALAGKVPWINDVVAEHERREARKAEIAANR